MIFAPLAIFLFVAGTLARFLSELAEGVNNDDGVPGVLNAIGSDPNEYILAFVASGAAWCLLGLLIWRFKKPHSLIEWLLYVIPITAAEGALSQILFDAAVAMLFNGEFQNPIDSVVRSFNSYHNPVYSAIALARGLLLVSIATGYISVGDPNSRQRAKPWSPATLVGADPHQVTRLLCGQAILGGSSFYEKVISYFKDRWTATAPEYGIDAYLLIRVCDFAQSRGKSYTLGFGGIGLVTLVLIGIEPTTSLLLGGIAGSGLWFYKTRAEQRLARKFSFANFSVEKTKELIGNRPSEEVDFLDVLPRRDQNLIVYSGFVPFVGSGFDLDGWSMVTFIDRPKGDLSVRQINEFKSEEIDLALEAALKKLSFLELSFDDVYFMRGIDVRDGLSLLDGSCRPVQQLGREEADRLVRLGVIRAYKRIKIVEWGGDIVITHFFRCWIQGRSLCLELRRFILPPIESSYRGVDFMTEDRIAKYVLEAITSIIIGPIYAVVAPFIVFGRRLIP
jgi:hypothetical protein